MKILAVLAFSVLTMSQAPAVVTIRDNQGGLIDSYISKRHAFERSHVAVRIEGDCASACAIYTGMKNVCIEDGATLYFHQGSLAAGTRAMLALMDPDLRKWIEARSLPTLASGEFLELSAHRAIAKGMMAKCL